jgi:hypothetical protein
MAGGVKMKDTSKFNYITYEWRGENGYKPRVCVHGWDVYPRYSVLAGQERKVFLDSFDTEEEARAAYPMADRSHPLLQREISLNHLPDDGDY